MKKVIGIMVMVFSLMICQQGFLYAKAKMVEGTIAGEIVCLLEFEADQEYQGTNTVCKHPSHTRVLKADDGSIYVLEAADEKNKEVMSLIRGNKYERKKVTIDGEIVEGGIVKIIKVKKFSVK